MGHGFRIGPLVLGSILLVVPARAAIFTVNSTADAPDALLDGTCDDGTGACTLRAAIQEANWLAGARRL